MKVAIIDADLIGRKKHRFPNLACEKISGYYKELGADVDLLLKYEDLDIYDEVFISKVFTDTPIPDGIVETDKIHLGGTGFFFDQAPPLPDEIEHHFPDYHLYDDWVDYQIAIKKFPAYQFKEYKDCAIGFLTRGCFRKCKFCVNQKYDHVFKHSPLSEFYDGTQKRICLLDDNFFGCGQWEEILNELIATKKPFRFKQGLDERLLTDKKCSMLFSSKYDGDFTFAFDNIEDYDLIEAKLKMIRKYTDKLNIKFYVRVGFKGTGAEDIEDAFKRIALLQRYKCLPYIMRYRSKDDVPYEHSKYRDMYIQLCNWCNQPSLFKKKSFRQFCEAVQARMKTDKPSIATRAATLFEHDNPEIARKYFDLKFGG